jgi:hypothetical protein
VFTKHALQRSVQQAAYTTVRQARFAHAIRTAGPLREATQAEVLPVVARAHAIATARREATSATRTLAPSCGGVFGVRVWGALCRLGCRHCGW